MVVWFFCFVFLLWEEARESLEMLDTLQDLDFVLIEELQMGRGWKDGWVDGMGDDGWELEMCKMGSSVQDWLFPAPAMQQPQQLRCCHVVALCQLERPVDTWTLRRKEVDFVKEELRAEFLSERIEKRKG